ncbi:hypothetical protein [Bradyrhizobium sp.]|uniref:hypothetical protein n=1 Tax=Bradyrhizobium sp. TaxID=376 RepID=UPI003C538408
MLQLTSGDATLLTAKEATQGPEPVLTLPSAGRWHIRINAMTLFRTISLQDDFDVPTQ